MTQMNTYWKLKNLKQYLPGSQAFCYFYSIPFYILLLKKLVVTPHRGSWSMVLETLEIE